MRVRTRSRPSMDNVSNSGGATFLPLTATRTMPSSCPTFRPSSSARARRAPSMVSTSKSGKRGQSVPCLLERVARSGGSHLFAYKLVGVKIDRILEEKVDPAGCLAQGLEPFLDQWHERDQVGGVDLQAFLPEEWYKPAGQVISLQLADIVARSSSPGARTKSAQASC